MQKKLRWLLILLCFFAGPIYSMNTTTSVIDGLKAAVDDAICQRVGSWSTMCSSAIATYDVQTSVLSSLTGFMINNQAIIVDSVQKGAAMTAKSASDLINAMRYAFMQAFITKNIYTKQGQQMQSIDLVKIDNRLQKSSGESTKS